MNPSFRALRIETIAGTTAENMADDCQLQEVAGHTQTLFCRNYTWTEEQPVTFGRYQKLSEVPRALAGASLIRRPTGGGIVDHRDDTLTWSMCIPRACCETDRVPVLFEHAQKSIARSLALTLRLDTSAAASDVRRPAHCFTEPVKHDLLDTEQRKISGIAMHRSRDTILLQGSLQVDNYYLKADDQTLLLENLCADMTGYRIEKTVPMTTVIDLNTRLKALDGIQSESWHRSRT